MWTSSRSSSCASARRSGAVRSISSLSRSSVRATLRRYGSERASASLVRSSAMRRRFAAVAASRASGRVAAADSAAVPKPWDETRPSASGGSHCRSAATPVNTGTAHLAPRGAVSFTIRRGSMAAAHRSASPSNAVRTGPGAAPDRWPASTSNAVLKRSRSANSCSAARASAAVSGVIMKTTHGRNGQRHAERGSAERKGGPQRQGRPAGETGWRPLLRRRRSPALRDHTTPQAPSRYSRPPRPAWHASASAAAGGRAMHATPGAQCSLSPGHPRWNRRRSCAGDPAEDARSTPPQQRASPLPAAFFTPWGEG